MQDKTKNNKIRKPKINKGNTVNYNGEVIITYTDANNKPTTIRKHNAGEIGLFTCIAKAIASQNITQWLPCRIKGFLKQGTQETPKFISSVYTQTNATLYYFDENTEILEEVKSSGAANLVELKFRVPYNYLKEDSDGVVNINHLKLYNSKPDGEEGSICAEVNLGNGNEVIRLISQNNLNILWRLYFSQGDDSNITINNDEEQPSNENE